MDKLLLRQIEFLGHCGITEAERGAGQRLSVDMEIANDMTAAARSDRLSDAVDYDRLCGDVVKLGRETRVSLIETLAERLAQRVLEDRRIASVVVRLTKCQPPREEIRGGVTVEILRAQPPSPPLP